MSTECRRCERKCELFICSVCMENLRGQLRDLPWWLDRLAESVVGQVKLSDGGRRSARRNTLHGEDPLAAHIDLLRGCKCEEGECRCDLGKARRQRHRDALARMLSTGRVNAKASDEYDYIQNMLGTWVRATCEERGLDSPVLNTASAMALWLAKHAPAIAASEAAAECCDDIARVAKNIERIVNRPIPPRFIGPCITDPAPDEILAKRRDEGDPITRCNFALTAHRSAEQVTCPTCKETYEVERLISDLYAQSDDKLMTVRELVDWVLPQLNEPVPQRTLERWIDYQWIEIRGYNEHGAKMVRLGDVRDIRSKRPRHKKAG